MCLYILKMKDFSLTQSSQSPDSFHIILASFALNLAFFAVKGFSFTTKDQKVFTKGFTELRKRFNHGVIRSLFKTVLIRV